MLSDGNDKLLSVIWHQCIVTDPVTDINS